MTKELAHLSMRLGTLTIFRGIFSNNVIKKLKELLWLSDYGENLDDTVNAYSDFVAALYSETPNLSDFLTDLILNDENFYIKERAKNITLSPVIETCLNEELALLETIGTLTSAQVQKTIGYHGFLPSWETKPLNIKEKYYKRLMELPHTGYGIYAKYSTFSIKDNQLVPVKFPDIQPVDSLYGYERERKLIDTNTQAILNNEGSNMLLYGDAGTGKSSTIKSICNYYNKDGLRLVEIKKSQLFEIPAIIEKLSDVPLKFVLFIDDLSFTSNDDNFSALKAILEGSVYTGGDNITVYATSNRRHLLRENHSDRDGDELHINDTLQETMSLAARFGLTITFESPQRDEYLYIVDKLAAEYGLSMDSQELHTKAEAHAIRNNGRSPRVAKQFVELQKIGI